MKIVMAIIGLAVVVSLAGVIFIKMNLDKGPVACTLEAMLCPDGSFVGRTGPNCEFTKCPEPEINPDDEFRTSGVVMGKVSIGPLCPVEPCSDEQPDIYSSRKIMLKPMGGGRPIDLPIYIKINPDGTFEEEVPSGNYELTLTDCGFMGCRYGFPKIIKVEIKQTLNIDIEIDTGIR